MGNIISLISVISPFIVLVITLLIGGSLTLFLDTASMVFVIFGTLTAGAASSMTLSFKEVIKNSLSAMKNKKTDYQRLMDFFDKLIVEFRKNGIIGLEHIRLSEKTPHPFLDKAIYAVSMLGDEDAIRKFLNFEKITYLESLRKTEKFYETLSGYSVSFGLLGTIIGLVYMLANLEDPKTIGKGLALALITTFYGLILSNMVFTPLSLRIRDLYEKEEKLLDTIESSIIYMIRGYSRDIIRETIVDILSGKKETKKKEEE